MDDTPEKFAEKYLGHYANSEHCQNLKIILVAALGGIQPIGEYDSSDQIFDLHYFTNDSQYILTEALRLSPDLKRQIGEINYHLLERSKALIFLQIDFTDMEVLGKFLQKSDLSDFTQKFHMRIKAFLRFLWLEKDCSAFTNNLLCILPHFVTSSDPLSCVSNCKGHMSAVAFNQNEIRSAMKSFSNYRQAFKREGARNKLKAAGELPSVFSKDMSRFSKSFLML